MTSDKKPPRNEQTVCTEELQNDFAALLMRWDNRTTVGGVGSYYSFAGLFIELLKTKGIICEQ